MGGGKEFYDPQGSARRIFYAYVFVCVWESVCMCAILDTFCVPARRNTQPEDYVLMDVAFYKAKPGESTEAAGGNSS